MNTKPIHVFFAALFLFAIGLVSAYQSFRKGEAPQLVGQEIADQVRKELDEIDQELEPLIASGADLNTARKLQTSNAFYIYNHGRLRYWSDNSFIPPMQLATDTFDVTLISLGSVSYLAKKNIVDADQFIISVILLQRKYAISNDYLKPEWNHDIFPHENFTILDINASTGIPVCVGQNCLFKIHSPLPNYGSSTARMLSVIFLSLAALFTLLFLYKLLTSSGRKYPELVFVLMYLTFLGVRVVMTRLNFPGTLIHTPLFDPQYFASSSLNASLGDLLLNVLCVLILCYYLFKNFHHFHFLKLRQHTFLSWLIDTVASLLILFAGLYPFVVVQTIYNNSSIVLDISSSLEFDVLRVVALIIFLISGISAFLFSHAFIRILVGNTARWKVIVAYISASFIFIAFNQWSSQVYVSSLLLTTGFFFIVFFLGLYRSLKRLSYQTFAYMFVGVFFLAANGAYAIQYFSQKEKIENQFRFANNFLIDRDDFGEYLLHEASRKIENDAFIKTRMMSPFLGKEAIRQKIRQVFLPSYFNKYDVEIFLFNSMGTPVDNSIPLTFSELIKRYDEDAYRTGYEGVRFVNSPETDVTQKYLIVVPLRWLSMTTGHIVVELSLKKVIPESVYPELLVDHQVQQFYRTEDLSYAVFADKKIILTAGEFNYQNFFNPSSLGDPDLYSTGITMNGYDHIAQEDQTGRVGVVSTKQTPFIYEATNFSFLFVLGLSVILIFIFFQGVFNYTRGKRLFFSARIQLYLNLAFFIPLIIVSVTTLSLTSRSSQQQLDSEYLNRSRIFGEQISGYLDDYLNNADGNQIPFDERLADLAKLLNLDANLYSTRGQLLATSQPLIFESNLLSNYINAKAFFKITGGLNSTIESERVGELEYFVVYSALKSSQTGKLIGILGIPFFQSAHLLEKVQIGILINILNIFAVIFIVLLVLSYFVSEWLTFPLRFITQSLRRTSLTNTNKPLTWTASDEIGLMVKEYNSMLFKLSESKSELEQTQREKAWREIAQQVAHEIKNPLTPMKLTLQQLERSLQSGNGGVEKTQKAVAALLAQVDTLNEIASSFSGFAKMPEPVMAKLELVSLVRRVVDLHSPTGDIQFRSPIKEIVVNGDEQLLSRTFSNLILNGLQSGNAGETVTLSVSIELTGTKVQVLFRDNGKGIDAEIADRIFLPHFSTKKSGSGLGLAIAKQAIEQMKGRIYFETKINAGTLFVVELPLAEPSY